MKKLKFPLFMLAVAIALTTSFAFKPATKHAGDPITYFYTYNSTLLADMQDVDHWEESGPSCSSSGNAPCSITVDGDKEALSDYLDDFESPEDITNSTVYRRTVAQ